MNTLNVDDLIRLIQEFSNANNNRGSVSQSTQDLVDSLPLAGKNGPTIQMNQGDIEVAMAAYRSQHPNATEQEIGLEYQRLLSLGDRDMMNSYAQTLQQTGLNELNYQRSLENRDYNSEQKQLERLMSTGLSRAAALAALQSSSTAVETGASITPTPSNSEVLAEQKRQNTISNWLNGAQIANQLINTVSNLAMMPFDVDAKQISSNIMNSQSEMLAMQLQGMQDAAAFVQAVSNNDATVEDERFKIGSLPIQQQYEYFAQAASRKVGDVGFNLGSYAFGNGQIYKRALSNPFFWSTLNETIRNKNFADASMYEPERANQLVSQIRSANAIAETEKNIADLRFKIMSNEEFISTLTRDARAQMESARLLCEQKGFEFDGKRAQAFLDRVQTFTDYDFQNVSFQLNKLREINDPVVFTKMREELVSSLDYNVASYIYGNSLIALKDGVLSEMNSDPELQPKLRDWTSNFLHYNELGYNNYTSPREWVQTGVTAATSIGAAVYAGYKIFGQKAADALRYSVSRTSSTLAMPLNFVPSTTPLLMPQNSLNGYISDGIY